MNDRILSLLGLCRRAGKTVIGQKAGEAAVKDGSARLALCAKDASPHSKKSLKAAADAQGVSFIETPFEKDELSFALGKLCAVMVITDEGFSKKLKEMLETIE